MTTRYDQVRDEEKRTLVEKNHEQPNYHTVDFKTASPSPQQRGSTLIEPVMLMFLVAKALSDTVVTNLLENRTCQVELLLPSRNCSEPLAPDIEDVVQPTTAHVIMARSLLEAFLPSCLAVLVGPWSDHNGRKPFLLLALIGMAVTYLCWGCLALLPGIHPHVFLLGSLPLSLTGGTCSIYLLIFCYISDVTDESTRPFRMSVLALAIYTSAIFGLLCAPLLLDLQSPGDPYAAVFFLSAGLLFLTAMYTHCCVRESVHILPERETSLFKLDHIRDLASTCFKAREGHARTMALLIISTLTICVFQAEGEGSIQYLSTREMFSWQLSDFSLYSSFGCIAYGIGALAGVWLLSAVLKLPNMCSVALALSTRCARNVIMALATTGRDFYIATFVSSLVASFSPLCRTELSLLVSKQDLGKIFALTAFFESLTPMAASPLYTYIYEATFLSEPSAVYWLSLLLSALCVLMILVVGMLQLKVGGACYIRESPGGDKEERT